MTVPTVILILERIRMMARTKNYIITNQSHLTTKIPILTMAIAEIQISYVVKMVNLCFNHEV